MLAGALPKKGFEVTGQRRLSGEQAGLGWQGTNWTVTNLGDGNIDS